MGDSRPPPLPTCTLPMNQLTKPESDEICSAYPQGVLDQYNTAEIQQIDKLQEAAVTVNSAEANYRYEVIRLKLMLDGEDQAKGLVSNGAVGAPPSRFWDGSRAGHFGERLQVMAKKKNFMTVNRWMQANQAACVLLGNSITGVREFLPLEAASERGIGASTLEIYASLSPDQREVADFYYEKTSVLKADMLKGIRSVCSDFPERKDELLQGISDESLKYPSHIDDLIEEWRAQAREQKAAEEALAQAAALAAAEANEQESNDYKPTVETQPHVGDQPQNVAARRTPSRAWYESPSGKKQVSEVVGNLDQPLPDLIQGLSELSKRLEDQFAHSSSMHNYAEFWAGYDQFFYTPSTHRAKWGRRGRLGRMGELRKRMLEVAGKLDVYITATKPPANIEYPES